MSDGKAWDAWEQLPMDQRVGRLAVVMREHSIARVECLGLKLELEPSKPVATPVNVDLEQAKREAVKREDEILFASSEGFAR